MQKEIKYFNFLQISIKLFFQIINNEQTIIIEKHSYMILNICIKITILISI